MPSTVTTEWPDMLDTFMALSSWPMMATLVIVGGFILMNLVFDFLTNGRVRTMAPPQKGTEIASLWSRFPPSLGFRLAFSMHCVGLIVYRLTITFAQL